MELNTERLLLRPMAASDAEAVLAYRSDALANQYQGWIPKTLADVHDFMANRVSRTFAAAGTWYQFVLVKRENGELIGDMGVHFLAADEQEAELGYTLARDHQGKGYATEALARIIDCLFNDQGKQRLVTAIDPRNRKSLELVERLGFRKEAHAAGSVLPDGGQAADLVYAILKGEWRAGRRQPGLDRCRS